jgi:hypothetical protein
VLRPRLSGLSTPLQRLSLSFATYLPRYVVDDISAVRLPRLSFCTLQHFRFKKPFCALSLQGSRLEAIARASKSPVLRVWLPSLRRKLSQTWEVSFNLQRSWVSPFRAFLLSHELRILSNSSIRSGAFLDNPIRTIYRRSNGLFPPEKPYPSMLSED